MKVGIIGLGVIGDALFKACDVKGISVVGYDKYKPSTHAHHVVKHVLLETDIIFMCLPSPTKGKVQDLDAIYQNIEYLAESEYKGVVVLRSTLIPGTTRAIECSFPELKIAHCPEFLTAASPFEDLIKQKVVLVGATDILVADKVREFWRLFDKKVPIRLCDSPTTTEMAKYVHNCFLATKVSFFNDISELCVELGIDYHNSVQAAMSVGQIGEGHAKVPGPDGKLGFGGMCFIKDTAALLAFAHESEVPLEVIEAVVKKNRRIRPGAYNGTEATGYSD